MIDGKDVLISRCIKGRNEEKCEALSLFLPPSQAPLRASNCLSIFLCENKYVATGYESGPREVKNKKRIKTISVLIRSQIN